MSKEAIKLATEFNRYFTSMNGVDVPERVSVPRDEWRALFEALAAQPAQDNTYGYAKSLAEAIFKQHYASDEHYASGRIVWGVNDTVIGILTQIDNMVADMVRGAKQPAQQEPVAVVSGYYGGQCVILPIDPARILNSNTALYTSQPAQQEPACYKHGDEPKHGCAWCDKQPAQEPVATVRTWHKNGDQHAELDDWGLSLALLPDGKHDLYTSPPARRKPLTDDEIWREYRFLWPFHPEEERKLASDILMFARAIEAAHGIKENT